MTPPSFSDDQRKRLIGHLIASNFEAAQHDAQSLLDGIDIAIVSGEKADANEASMTFRPGGVTIHISDLVSTVTYQDISVRLVEMLPAIAFIASNVTREGQVAICLRDHGPATSLCFCQSTGSGFLIPDSHFVSSNAYEAERAELLSVPDFSTRLPVAFWRGTTTGNRVSGWRSLPRIKLCQLAQMQPHAALFDCKITRVIQEETEAEHAEIAGEGLLGDFVSSSAFVKYKYQIDIDGNSNSWPGLFIKLLTGSPVLKVLSPHKFRQWYYERLQPWFNYVPVESDLSDLVENLNWLIAHPAAAERIGSFGRELALGMTYERELCRAVATVERILRDSA